MDQEPPVLPYERRESNEQRQRAVALLTKRIAWCAVVLASIHFDVMAIVIGYAHALRPPFPRVVVFALYLGQMPYWVGSFCLYLVGLSAWFVSSKIWWRRSEVLFLLMAAHPLFAMGAVWLLRR